MHKLSYILSLATHTWILMTRFAKEGVDLDRLSIIQDHTHAAVLAGRLELRPREAMEGGRVTRPASACRFVVPPPGCHPSGAFRRLPLDRPGSPTRTLFTLQLVAVEPRRRSAPGSDWRLACWARGAAPAPGASHRPSRRGRAGSARFFSRLVSPGARRISAVRNAELHVSAGRNGWPPGRGFA